MGLSALIGPSFDAISKIISEFHLAPDEKIKLQQAQEELRQNIAKQADDFEVQLNETASKNITADANSKDMFTERARPMFMYLVEAILGMNYLFIPFCAIFGSKLQPFPLPGDLLVLFGTCITGYVFSRSVDKALALPGNTQINVLGMKMANDGAPAKP